MQWPQLGWASWVMPGLAARCGSWPATPRHLRRRLEPAFLGRALGHPPRRVLLSAGGLPSPVDIARESEGHRD
eukprot:5064373-Alexandrium_andersonii.AAC.1